MIATTIHIKYLSKASHNMTSVKLELSSFLYHFFSSGIISSRNFLRVPWGMSSRQKGIGHPCTGLLQGSLGLSGSEIRFLD